MANFAHANNRKALVIGNGDYSRTKLSTLPNPIRDAELIAETLRSIGFEVTEKLNLSKRNFDTSIDDFVNTLNNNDIAFIYYAGHGISYKDKDYLIPIEPNIPDLVSLDYDAIKAQQLLDRVSVRSRHTILVLDACRDTPYSKSTNTRGLGHIQSHVGSSYVIYAARKGQEAYDNRVFARSLAKELRQKQSLSEVSRKVRNAVMKASDGTQYPSVIDDLLQTTPIYLNGKPGGETHASRPIAISHNDDIEALMRKLAAWHFDDETPKEHNIDVEPEDTIKCSDDISYKDFKKFKLTMAFVETMQKKSRCLIDLILHTESMDDEERKYWFDLLPSMTDEQIEKLYEILRVEKIKLQKLEEKYAIEISLLNNKHLLNYYKETKKINEFSYQEINGIIRSVKSILLKNPPEYVMNKSLNLLTRLFIDLSDQALESKMYFDLYKEIEKTIHYATDKNTDKQYLYDLSRLLLAQSKRAFDKGFISKYELQSDYLSVTWYSLFLGGDYLNSAIRLSEEALSLNEGYLPLWTNYAHALALSGQEQQAKNIYLRFVGKRIDNRSWRELILKDFNALLEQHISAPVFAQIKILWLGSNPERTDEKRRGISSKRGGDTPSQNQTVAEAIPAGTCALIVASRKTIPEVRDYIEENISDRRYLTVFRAQNGWYAISIGTLEPEKEEAVMDKWKNIGKIPDDSFCTDGKKMLETVNWHN